MVFGRKTGQKFYLGDKELQIVESYKYLGLMIDKNFNWKKHLEKILEKARKRTRALYGMGIREGVSVRALLRGWEVLVGVWGGNLGGEKLEGGRKFAARDG